MSKRVLIVEDDAVLCAALARVAARWGDIDRAHTVRDALRLLENDPFLLIADVRLPDGDAVEVVEAAGRRRPAPTMVAWSGQASPEEAFRLAQAGVRAYLAKPVSLDDFAATVEDALLDAPAIEPVAVAAVGHWPLRAVQGAVRRAMVDQAMARAGGNRSEAARLLSISRQAVQQALQAQKAPGDAQPKNG